MSVAVTLDTPVQWAAQVANVREVSLVGTADLAFWSDRLAKEDLVPVPRDRRAQVTVIAADMKYMGVRFREVSFSVVARPRDDEGRPAGALLVRAFNSAWLFALMERTFFGTPYYHADCRVTVAPAAVAVSRKGETPFWAERRSSAKPSRVGVEGFDGPVYLPGRPGREGQFFVADVRGQTRTYPFVPGEDVLEVRPAEDAEVFRLLLDSGFAGREWAVREDAIHAKSKTYRRSQRVSVVVG